MRVFQNRNDGFPCICSLNFLKLDQVAAMRSETFSTTLSILKAVPTFFNGIRVGYGSGMT